MKFILKKLEGVKESGDGFMACCPAHGDSNPSLSVVTKEDKILLHCFSGCSTEDILKSLDLEMSSLFMTSAKKEKENVEDLMEPLELNSEEYDPNRKSYNSYLDVLSSFKDVEDHYLYNKEGEEPYILQVRYKVKGKKTFATYHLEEDGKWYSGRPRGLTPLYNLNKVLKANSVLIVEGEKLVKILEKHGITATTNLGGSSSSTKTDWSPLLRAKSVVMWRDYDEPGLKHQKDITSLLFEMGVLVRTVAVEDCGLKPKDDLEQFIERLPKGANVMKEIIKHIPKAESLKPVSILKYRLDSIREGRIKNLEIPFFPLVTENVRFFKPGSQAVIYSKGGIGKSLFISRTSDEWNLSGYARSKRLMLESTMDFHLLRSLAQQASRTDVLREEFHYNNPDESIKIIETFEDILAKIGETITTSDTGIKRSINQWTVDNVLSWIENNAPDNDVLFIDPISICLTDPVYTASNRLTKGAEEILIKNPHLCIVWVHHPSEDGVIAGGKAWQRYTSSTIEIIMNEEPVPYEVVDEYGEIDIVEVSTYFNIRKVRNGPGMGWKVAINIDKDDLTMKEIGRMLKKHK